MAFEFRLPDLGEGIHEAEVRRWLVAEGQPVREDQPLVEVETDKAVVEIPSPAAGIVVRHGAGEGEVVAVGSVLATIEKTPSEEPLGIVGFVPHAATVPQPPLQATPIARRVAKELGVEITQIKGTGPEGRVTEEDVRLHAGLPREEERVPLRGLRKRIAERMVQSAFSAPHVTAMEEADVTNLVALRARALEVAEARGIKLTFLPFIVKAVVSALTAHPFLNASLDPQAGAVVLKRYYHIGIATATEEGLLVPVIRDADRKDLWEIARELARLTEAARARTIGHDDLRGSTFTISNYGAFGGLFATPIINPPEVAILGVGRIQDRPVVRDGHIVVRKLMGVSLSFDHRAVDGEGAGRFLSRVIESLETPDPMMPDAGRVS